MAPRNHDGSSKGFLLPFFLFCILPIIISLAVSTIDEAKPPTAQNTSP